VKIPEIPGNYRPGDVVNGFILTERGHWVAASNPRAAGLRRRYLSTQVSTIRDPAAPSSVLSGQAAATTARTAAPRTAAPQTTAPQTAAPRTAAPQTAAPRTAAHQTAAPRTATPTHQARAQPGGVYAPAPGQQQPASTNRRGVGCLVAIVVFFVILGLVVTAIGRIASSFSSQVDNYTEETWAGEPEVEGEDRIATGDDWPGHEVVPGEDVADGEEPGSSDSDPSTLPWRLSDEEVALFELASWEVWHDEYSSHYVISVAAPGLERPYVSTSVSIEAVDADGVVHETSDFVSVRWGEPTVSIGFFPEVFDAEVTELRATFAPIGARNDRGEYAVWFEEGTVDSSGYRPVIRGTIAADGDEAPAALRLTVVVRNEDGDILNIGTGHPPVPEPGETAEVEFSLWGSVPVSGTDNFEFTFMQM